MAKLKLDLHDIYNRGGQIDAELNRIVQEALQRITTRSALSSRINPSTQRCIAGQFF